jgi:hypothetical protein
MPSQTARARKCFVPIASLHTGLLLSVELLKSELVVHAQCYTELLNARATEIVSTDPPVSHYLVYGTINSKPVRNWFVIDVLQGLPHGLFAYIRLTYV